MSPDAGPMLTENIACDILNWLKSIWSRLNPSGELYCFWMKVDFVFHMPMDDNEYGAVLVRDMSLVVCSKLTDMDLAV